MSSGAPMRRRSWRIPDMGPFGCSRMNHPSVRTRKLVQNGTIVSPSRIPRQRGGTLTASQYAKGKPISRQRIVPVIEICSVPLKTVRKVAEKDSAYRSNDGWSVAIVRKMSGLYPNEYQKMNRTGTAKKNTNRSHAGIARAQRGARRRRL